MSQLSADMADGREQDYKQLFEKVTVAQQQQLHLSKMLQKVGALLTTSLTLNQVYEKIFDYLAEIIKYDSVTLYLADKPAGDMILVASRGFADPAETDEKVKIYEKKWLQCIPMPPNWAVIADTHHDSTRDIMSLHQIVRSWVGAALLIKGRLIGVLNVASNLPNQYDATQAETVAAFANQAAVAIENARLHKQVLEQANALAILHKVTMGTAVTMSEEKLLQTTTQMTAEHLYADVFGFIMIDPQSGQLKPFPSFHGVPKSFLKPIVPYESLAGLVAQTSTIIVTADVSQEPLYTAGMPIPGIRSVVMVPLKIKETVIGILDVESLQPNAFTEKDARFLATLASNVAAAIERARLYEASLSQADLLAEQVSQQTAALQTERDRTIAILEGAGEGIVLTDTAATILYANPAMEHMSGYGRAELLGHKAHILGDSQAKLTFKKLWATVRSNERWSGEFLNQRQDGTLYPITLTITPICDETSAITGYVSVHADISCLKEVDQLKAEFVSNVTHELRTPLTNIKTYVSLLERGRPENFPRYFQVLHQETERLNQLIQDLLDISHLDAEFTIAPETVTDIVSVLQEIKEFFATRLAQKGHSLQILRPQSQSPVTQIGNAHLKQVLTNIIENAILYSPPDSTIFVEGFKMTHKDKMMSCIKVQDEGGGISEEEQTRLFERFFRGTQARELNVPGSGLGLATARKIIEQYSGLIEVESVPGQGTCISIWLPIAEV
ncbi:MAG: GAF domain-containing protein [Chloroflexi bacterium]|nr:GAF domain-containing protein [Chloroflexota bacterium]